MAKEKEQDFVREFSEAVDEMLAGEKIEPYPDMPDDYREAIDFARKLIDLKGAPRPSFKAQLKDSLLSKLSEMEQERPKRNRFREGLKHLLPQRPMWRAVAASLLVIAAAGIIWGTGILTPPSAPAPMPIPTPTPAPTPTPPPPWPTPNFLELEATPAKSACLPGEDVEIEFEFKNASSESITITPFPPRMQVMRPRPWETIRAFAEGSEELRLQPGEIAKYTLVWEQQDDSGQQVAPGWYYLDVQGITVTKGTPPTTRSGMGFGTITKVLIQFPQGAMEKTIEVNQSQTANRITITLERVELSAGETKFYAFTTTRLTEEGTDTLLAKLIPIHAQYTVDGSAKDAGYAAERLLDQGTELIWNNLDPLPSDARELTFTITKFGDWQGPWEFNIPLQ
ncbi:MAG: hypothetical protein U9R04_00860 [Chloroflexota bacterium]|nr:hypothetical protein [Chloroflexota bacterium]